MNSDPLKIKDVLERVFPAFRRGEKPTWPPDAFAIVASIFKHSGAYTKIVHRWPPEQFPTPELWQEHIEVLAREWYAGYKDENTINWPARLNTCWETVLDHEALSLEEVAADRHLIESLMTILAAADQVGAHWSSISDPTTDMQRVANQILVLDKSGTLSRSVHRSRAASLPKMHNPLDGLTLRSLTHNFALWEGCEVKVDWRSIDMHTSDDGEMHLLLLPWPLVVAPDDFRTIDISAESMPASYGFFGYDAASKTIDVTEVARLKGEAEKRAGAPIAAIVFPECSMTPEQFDRIQTAVPDVVVVAGIGENAIDGDVGANYVMIGSQSTAERTVIYQDKHHRWRLSEDQLRKYGLEGALAGKESWWEAIEIPERTCTFIDVNPWLTFCVLICEDLARQDPVAELVRSVGPTLVITLLMDGPQVMQRWSGRYATVLADDPRSSVLTLTCAGMVDLANTHDTLHDPNRSIGLWKDALGSEKELKLDQDAAGLLLSLKREWRKEWVADGRHDNGHTGYLVYDTSASIR